jgi:hypothetical protein
MKNRIGVTIGMLHVCAFISVATGVLLLTLAGDPDMTDAFEGTPIGFIAAVCSIFALAVEVTVLGLKKRKFWAWVAGLCLCAVYTLSVLLPLGALGLWGLLASGSRRDFGLGINEIPMNVAT